MSARMYSVPITKMPDDHDPRTYTATPIGPMRVVIPADDTSKNASSLRLSEIPLTPLITLCFVLYMAALIGTLILVRHAF